MVKTYNIPQLEEDDELESESGVQARMTSLGTNYNIANKWCSNVSSGNHSKFTLDTITGGFSVGV